MIPLIDIILVAAIAVVIYLAWCLYHWRNRRRDFKLWDRDYMASAIAGDLDEPDVSDFPDEMEFFDDADQW